MGSVKKTIKKMLIKVLYFIERRLGFSERNPVTFSSTDKNTLLADFFNILLSVGYKPNHIVDIGANHGTWTRECIKYFPDSYYSLFEPQYWLKESFQDILSERNRVRFFPLGVGNRAGTFKFTLVDRDDSCSFRYTEEEAKRRGFKQIEIPVICLDEFIVQEKLPLPDIVKIDAEGLDLEVLGGASSFFGKTEIFMVEASVNNKALDNTVLKVMNYMHDNGYRLFDITDINRPFRPKTLWLFELVFIRINGVIDSDNVINRYPHQELLSVK